MPPAKRMWLIRREKSGKMITVVATSDREAIKEAVRNHDIPEGTYLWCKERGAAGGWDRWKA